MRGQADPGSAAVYTVDRPGPVICTVGVGALPIIKKNYLSAVPETRRKRSVCSKVSKCTIERVPYLIFDEVMGI